LPGAEDCMLCALLRLVFGADGGVINYDTGGADAACCTVVCWCGGC